MIVVIDPLKRVLRAIDPHGERTYGAQDTFSTPALPDFKRNLGELFAELDY